MATAVPKSKLNSTILTSLLLSWSCRFEGWSGGGGGGLLRPEKTRHFEKVSVDDPTPLQQWKLFDYYFFPDGIRFFITYFKLLKVGLRPPPPLHK